MSETTFNINDFSWVKFQPNSTNILCAKGHSTPPLMRLIDKNFNLIVDYKWHGEFIGDAQFTECGGFLISFGENNIFIYYVESGDIVFDLKHNTVICALDYFNGKLVFSDIDGGVFLYCLDGFIRNPIKKYEQIGCYNYPVNYLKLNKDSTLLIIGVTENNVIDLINFNL